MIKAPFNFVPTPNKVFYPLKGIEDKSISLDIPFKNGISGCFDMTITAETPLFIRNGHGKSNEEEGKMFPKTPDGKYFIPATSVKGCIRSVLEIMSFCKMTVDKNSAFAQREWGNSELYSIKNVSEQSKLKCGWLVRKNDNYFVKKCYGNPYRINQRRIDEWLGSDIFENHFSADKKFDLNKETKLNGENYDPKTARFKYALLRDLNKTKKSLHNISFSKDNEYSTNASTRYQIDCNGDLKGTLVLTGQPDYVKNWYGQRHINNGKFYEFIFDEEIEKEIPISELEFSNYNFIYSDSDDWKEWREELDNDGIPVFFRTKVEDGKEKIKDMGLALLYKLPYENTPFDLEEKRQGKGDAFEPDMSECIFGYSEKKESQKGRVVFSNFTSDNAVADTEYTLIMNSPKASYYPIYIQQDGKGGLTNKYKTYNDGKLAGWKRYYLRNGVWVKNTNNPKLDTTIYPVKANSVFKGKVYFHNLQPQELGALLSAITFHDNEKCRHQLGQAKAYGFGKIKISIDKKMAFEDNENNHVTFDDSLALFEKALRKDGFYLEKENSVTELITMSSINVKEDEYSHYMTLDIDKNINEFIAAKGGDKGTNPREFLQPASVVLKGRNTIVSKYEQIKDKWEAEENLKKEYNDKLERLSGSFNSSYSAAQSNFDANNWKNAKELFESAKNELLKLIEIAGEDAKEQYANYLPNIEEKIKICANKIVESSVDSNANLYDVLCGTKHPVDTFDKWAKDKVTLTNEEQDILVSFFKSQDQKEQKKLVRECKFVKKNRELQTFLKAKLDVK